MDTKVKKYFKLLTFASWQHVLFGWHQPASVKNCSSELGPNHVKCHVISVECLGVCCHLCISFSVIEAYAQNLFLLLSKGGQTWIWVMLIGHVWQWCVAPTNIACTCLTKKPHATSAKFCPHKMSHEVQQVEVCATFCRDKVSAKIALHKRNRHTHEGACHEKTSW